jgi:hypothetical protein
MAYVVPNFNLLCNIWDGFNPGFPAPPVGPPRLSNQVCALVLGRRVNVASTGGTGSPGIPLQAMNLLLPALTDIRGPQSAISSSAAECPAGSGRFYGVYFVDDIGKGYANEHRTACILAIAGSWPDPYP